MWISINLAPWATLCGCGMGVTKTVQSKHQCLTYVDFAKAWNRDIIISDRPVIILLLLGFGLCVLF